MTRPTTLPMTHPPEHRPAPALLGKSLLALSCALLAFPLTTSASPASGSTDSRTKACEAQFQAAQTRIQREFARTRPPAENIAARTNWGQEFNAAILAAGKEAETCERASKPGLTAERRAKLDDCLAKNSESTTAVLRQFQGRTLSREEQDRQRATLDQLHQQRVECDAASRK